MVVSLALHSIMSFVGVTMIRSKPLKEHFETVKFMSKNQIDYIGYAPQGIHAN